jgi:hypothetical protein
VKAGYLKFVIPWEWTGTSDLKYGLHLFSDEM